MDFYRITEKTIATGENKGMTLVEPCLVVAKTKDLMIRGKAFYAVWNEKTGLWDTDEYSVPRIMDAEIADYVEKNALGTQFTIVRKASNFSSGVWKEFRKYVALLSDSYHQLDETITFADTKVEKGDYVSRRLPYSLTPGSISAYDEIMSTLYDPVEREKLEWAIGAIISGDARRIQKFMVLYGPAGTGKSTILNIIQKLFDGYYATFDAKSLTTNANAFSTEAFRTNPLIAIQHDGDLSRIENNTLLNSIVSHEEIIINEKYKSGYSSRINSFLFMGTNRPVKITDAKSGIIRRLIDVIPSGRLIPTDRYHTLINLVDFELGAIAAHCLDIYRRMGRDYYSNYRPEEMILQTDVFYNYIEHHYDIFKDEDAITLIRAYDLYKVWCAESGVEFVLPRHKFREELRNYFREFVEREFSDGERRRSVYRGFLVDKVDYVPTPETHARALILDETVSLLDDILKDCPAQYANALGTPIKKWANVDTTLSSLDTSEVHYVKVPQNHIVIDFDLKGPDGEKSAELNIAEASNWPATYAEFSKGGAGIHLHYLYSGDASELSRIFSEGIEIKVFVGDSSLRRRVSRCNNIPIATISGGLPVKEKRMIDFDTVRSERGLRSLIERNLRKEIHPATKPSVDFIHKILEDAYSSGLAYSVIDLRPAVLAFAMNSSNQSGYCVSLVSKMKFQSDHCEPQPPSDLPYSDEDRLVFYDVEVFPNLFHVSWKYAGESTVVRMVNPSPNQIEDLMKMKLVGFYNRKYDNHILYGRYMGMNNAELFKLSQDLISGNPNAGFLEAYNLSYADIYDYASAGNKKSLKLWQVELGIHHQELGLPWDAPVPEEMWDKVAEYCDNDVISTEAAHDHLASDFQARKILSRMSGLSVNDTTNKHSARIIFGTERNPQNAFVYTDLSEQFPGYKYDFGKSTYRGEITGEGGYVYSEPGMYSDVAVLDVASMHPTSIEQLNLFGHYTKKFSALKEARLAIKHGDIKGAGKLLGMTIDDDTDLKGLSDALKTVINSVYGLTSARFDNPFRDIRNVDNIVAKRGALFMIDLKHAVQEKGFQVVHIKTDSIKIPGATPEIIQFVHEFGESYGYIFEHEVTYEKFCLVNDAVYIAKKPGGDNSWDAVGAQFAHPYVYKTLFSKEPIEFDDLCETKSVTTALYLDFASTQPMFKELASSPPQFVGRVGRFCPMKEGTGGGILLREKEGQFHSATGAKGYFWMESEMVKSLGKEKDIDEAYFRKLVDAAVGQLEKYGDVEWFLE